MSLDRILQSATEVEMRRALAAIAALTKRWEQSADAGDGLYRGQLGAQIEKTITTAIDPEVSE